MVDRQKRWNRERIERGPRKSGEIEDCSENRTAVRPLGKQWGIWCIEFGSMGGGPVNLLLEEESENSYAGTLEDSLGNRFYIFRMNPREKTISVLDIVYDTLSEEEKEYLKAYWHKYEEEGWKFAEWK